jgi:hypothetical protein
MSDAYERERQNNSRLAELSSKVSALRGVTVDIYDNARAQDVIDNTVRFPSSPSLHPVVEFVGLGKYKNRGLTKLEIVRYILLDEHEFEGIGRTIGKNGC